MVAGSSFLPWLPGQAAQEDARRKEAQDARITMTYKRTIILPKSQAAAPGLLRRKAQDARNAVRKTRTVIHGAGFQPFFVQIEALTAAK